ncbi:NAD-dependent malic enzyme [Arsenicicoccus dermatophilus]|uniref:NAD-dependent malic enzyme n=1 Tax=Arsenicicoccus dermatophilus TaxID=1076331 RepID=UPI001F4D036B|nr:NAD-dependent malic enzyme [Arsenicicoccus dermatophilus]MCH8613818.1 NAD-dependent malic enzyme [Arsenicicoccus dermatophilus]
MASRPFEFESGPDGTRLRVRVRGNDVLSHPLTNRGTAFTKAERDALHLNGLMPSGVTPLESQVTRVYQQYSQQKDALSKNVYLSAMRDRNEVLFYRLLAEHLEEMLPIVYTPTIGEAIQRYSHWYNRPRGVFLSIDDPEGIENAFLNYGLDPEDVDLVVATDSEGILGIGDQGVGGVQIAVGKLSVYTAAAGIHPRRAIPVVLDVGTDNLELLNDDLYLGVRHARVRGERYDAFIEKFVEVTTRLYPHAMLHWEDFGASNAHRILERYRGEICTFNDDVQGTAAVVAAAALAGVKALGERMSDQRIVVHGAGTAGVGIADLMRDMMIREGLSPEAANQRFWCLGSRGLITTALGDRVRDFQRPYARSDQDVTGWRLTTPGRIGLADVVRGVHPTILIGTSGQPGAFTEAIVRDMAAHTSHPIVMPLSNPTSLAEATPAQIVEWTGGKAAIATGSPFAPVVYQNRTYHVAQANNALVFPGLGLGVSVCRATRVSDGMIAAAAEAIAGISGITRPEEPLLPSITQLRYVSATVALAVVKAAQGEGLATVEIGNPVQAVYQRMWHPVYPELEAV